MEPNGIPTLAPNRMQDLNQLAMLAIKLETERMAREEPSMSDDEEDSQTTDKEQQADHEEREEDLRQRIYRYLASNAELTERLAQDGLNAFSLPMALQGTFALPGYPQLSLPTNGDYCDTNPARTPPSNGRKRSRPTGAGSGSQNQEAQSREDEDEDVKTQLRREKNRLAARKCRAKKVQCLLEMEKQVQVLIAQNQAMYEQLMSLQQMCRRMVGNSDPDALQLL